MIEEAVNAGDANVVEVLGAITHHSGGEQGFFGDGDVAGASGNDEDSSLPR